MASRRSILDGRVCARIGHLVYGDWRVCRRCQRQCRLERQTDGSPQWIAIERHGLRQQFPKRGPWSRRHFLSRWIPLGPAQPEMCDDCAFRPGSPERQDIYGTWTKVLHGIATHAPFYCHDGMPVNERGEYRPQLDAQGHPIGAKLCGGWMREHRFYHRPGNGLVSKAALPREDEQPWTSPTTTATGGRR